MYIPRPLDATSVATRMGARPVRNSTTQHHAGKTLLHPSEWRNYQRSHKEEIVARTSQHPIPLRLRLVSMDTHCRPPETQHGCHHHRTPQTYDNELVDCRSLYAAHHLAPAYPSRFSLRAISSHFLFVSTKMRLLFSFSPMISSNNFDSLMNIIMPQV